MGMGKSGHIGRKIAATLASTGTPAMFVHPAEASHGDLGMIKPVDVVLGDALAVALLDARGFKAEDFARSHPGGALGRKLLTLVSDVMRSGDQVPRVRLQASFSELMREMSAKGLGASAVVDASGQVQGIFTDGDLRRLIEKGADLRSCTAQQVMHPQPATISRDALAVDAVELMEQRRITSVLVLDADGKLCGALNSNDLMRAKVI
jgi:arabinose-5-phosphate isomerase